MALTIINKPRKARRFIVYDLEWVPGTMKLRLAGVFDGGKYRCYYSIEDFLNGELTPKNNGAWFYAHAGGMADLTFVLQRIVEAKDYIVKASFSGSSAIIAHFSDPEKTSSYHFVDSYWLLRDSLENIGKWIGVSKGHNVPGWEDFSEKQKQEWYGSVPIEQLRVYNQQDCIILWRAIDAFENTLLELGGQLQMTLASSAMHLFRRRFLTKEIATSTPVNNCARNAYFSSRVEIFQSEAEESFYYDINSSFPFAMTQACPGNFLGASRHLPDHGIYIADVTVEIDEQYLPSVPFRIKDRVFFPSGQWSSWLTSVDIELLQQNGGRILSVREVLKFDPFYDLAAYSVKLYDLRKRSTNEFARVAYKLLLNSLYGKFGESAEKQSLILNPAPQKLQALRDKESATPQLAEMLFPGAWLEDTHAMVAHMHVPIAAHITALARKTLYEFLSNCRKIYYSDTDSIVTVEDLSTSGELGKLKKEHDLAHADFYLPKLYRMEDREGNTMLKAKGFSLGKKGKPETQERFETLIHSGKVEIRRMGRIKELYRKGAICPSESLIVKGLRGDTVHKRMMYPDGTSRPWHVDELRDMLGKEEKQ